MATTKRRIHNKGDYRQEERDATAVAIQPGMLIMLTSTGAVQAHNVEGGRAEAFVAGEDALQGKTVTDNYAVSAKVTCLLPAKGSVVNMLIEDGQDIAIGDELISAGNGTLKEGSDLESGETLSKVIFIAEEVCDLTGSDTSNTLCACRVL